MYVKWIKVGIKRKVLKRKCRKREKEKVIRGKRVEWVRFISELILVIVIVELILICVILVISIYKVMFC